MNKHIIWHRLCMGDGAIVDNRDLVNPGLTLSTSTWEVDGDWFNGFRLFDIKGNIINEWRVSPEYVWNEKPHDDPQPEKSWNGGIALFAYLLLPIINLKEHCGLVYELND